MKYKNLIWATILGAAALLFATTVYAVTLLPVPQGGTGLGSVNLGDLLIGTSSNRLIQLPIGATSTVLTSNGNQLSWSSAASGGSIAGYLYRFTSSTYTGSIAYGSDTGYKAANAICAADAAGTHICTPDEILMTIKEKGTTSTATAWIANGPPGYTANANDCVGMTANTVTYLGAFWSFDNTTGGAGYLVNCSNVKPLACCKQF